MPNPLQVISIATLLLSCGDARTLATRAKDKGYIKYSTVKGYFLQDDPSTNATTFDYVRHMFLLEWKRED